MLNLAERFVMDWLNDNIENIQHRADECLIVERLLLKLENDARNFGLQRMELSEAMNGDPCDFVSFEIKKALWRDLARPKTFSVAKKRPALVLDS